MAEKTIAFIPVREGSKSIPLKNIKTLCGKPLVSWALEAALATDEVDEVVVSTDSDIISETIIQYFNKVPNVNYHKLQIYRRSSVNATDKATTESAMLEYAKEHLFETIILLQATSPLVMASHIRQGIDKYKQERLDSLLSLVRQKRFVWEIGDDKHNLVTPYNYKISSRPRRQEQSGFLVENGAIYITSRERLIRSGQRISGKIGYVEMPEESYIELDEPLDWTIIETILSQRQKQINNNLVSEKAKKIKLFAMDCDGVLTDAGMYYSADGNELKKFNTKDGMGIKMLRERGIYTAIITGEDISVVKKRADKLRINELYMGVIDKVAVLEAICDKYNLQFEEVAYIGDDINDVEVLKRVGFSFAVADSHPSLNDLVDYKTTLPGGKGAVREAIDLILTSKQNA